MTRIMLIQPILLGFSNIFAAIVQVKNRYILYATTPLVYNIGIIFGVIVLYPLFGLIGLAWGVVFGAMMHVSIQIPSIMSDGFLRKLPSTYNLETFKDTMSVSLPRAITLAMSQANLFFLIAIAGTLATGSIAVFTLAFNLQAVPLAIIGASYSVAAFPMLARILSNGEKDLFMTQVSAASRHIIFWSLPAISLAIVLRAHVVRVILGTGAFDWTDTRLTAAAFALFVISLTAHAIMLLLIRSYYAAGKTLTPFVVSSLVLLLSVGFGYAFLGAFGVEQVQLFIESLLRVEDVPGTEVLVLPLAYSIASIIGVILLVVLFEIKFGGFIRRVSRAFGESFAAAGVAGFMTYGVLTILGGINEATTFLAVLTHGFVSGALGILAATSLFWLSGNREFLEIIRTARDKYSGKTVLSGETEL
jgi:putative peptidoglycan lipid II flippase